ncbi:amidohydrolase family protein [Pigmentiphaga aceris]|uniref:Amidohydrolase family protein n=1 Tax=Pigmentiphaga aceris TaxID=1940612 RepID=A0A5C0B4D1_9BURK|nr:amidohydrolase family protein [Pigmentiphaga aceris]QEI08533.1 amidohydrolase family protein [Pigmentiphaga aceris]
MSGNYLSVRPDWLALGEEEALEPTLPIIDAHHHFYDRPGWTYLDADYLADAGTGHAIEATVYMQALTRYRDTGSEHLKPVGETEYVVSATNARTGGRQLAQGIVGYADLRRGAAVQAVLEAHEVAGQGRFRGIRHLVTWDADSSLSNPLTAAPRGLLADPAYRAGLAALAVRGLSYDAWLLWPQLPELIDVADAFPDLPIIVNHCGGVVRIGAYAGRDDEIFQSWQGHMRALAKRPNVFVKLGGLGMRINGFGFEKAALPPTSRQLADAWRPWMASCIDAFGPMRCMFESNFPVDKGSYSFTNGWNAFKRLTQGFSDSERRSLFHDTARRVYRLG